jgi:hypothetical protein
MQWQLSWYCDVECFVTSDVCDVGRVKLHHFINKMQYVSPLLRSPDAKAIILIAQIRIYYGMELQIFGTQVNQ